MLIVILAEKQLQVVPHKFTIFKDVQLCNSFSAAVHTMQSINVLVYFFFMNE